MHTATEKAVARALRAAFAENGDLGVVDPAVLRGLLARCERRRRSRRWLVAALGALAALAVALAVAGGGRVIAAEVTLIGQA